MALLVNATTGFSITVFVSILMSVCFNWVESIREKVCFNDLISSFYYPFILGILQGVLK